MRTSSSSTTDPSVNGVADVATTKIKVVDDEDDALRLKPRYRELPHSVKISGIPNGFCAIERAQNGKKVTIAVFSRPI